MTILSKVGLRVPLQLKTYHNYYYKGSWEVLGLNFMDETY